MLRFNSSWSSRAGVCTASLACLALLALAAPSISRGETLILNIHDGVPWNSVYGITSGEVVGNFIPGLHTVGYVTVIERIWFYHGGPDYASSGIPYEVQVAVRHQHGPGGDYDEFAHVAGIERMTTCNFCWEEIVIGQPVGIGYLGGVIQVGVFFRPLGGHPGLGVPRIWVDAAPNYEHAATMLEFYESPIHYGNHWYFSDGGVGEVMIGMEISGDVVTPTEPMSFSALKSLY